VPGLSDWSFHRPISKNLVIFEVRWPWRNALGHCVFGNFFALSLWD